MAPLPSRREPPKWYPPPLPQHLQIRRWGLCEAVPLLIHRPQVWWPQEPQTKTFLALFISLWAAYTGVKRAFSRRTTKRYPTWTFVDWADSQLPGSTHHYRTNSGSSAVISAGYACASTSPTQRRRYRDSCLSADQ